MEIPREFWTRAAVAACVASLGSLAQDMRGGRPSPARQAMQGCCPASGEIRDLMSWIRGLADPHPARQFPLRRGDLPTAKRHVAATPVRNYEAPCSPTLRSTVGAGRVTEVVRPSDAHQACDPEQPSGRQHPRTLRILSRELPDEGERQSETSPRQLQKRCVKAVLRRSSVLVEPVQVAVAAAFPTIGNVGRDHNPPYHG